MNFVSKVQKAKKISMGEKIATSPYVRILCAPQRLDSFTKRRLPRSFLQKFTIMSMDREEEIGSIKSEENESNYEEDSEEDGETKVDRNTIEILEGNFTSSKIIKELKKERNRKSLLVPIPIYEKCQYGASYILSKAEYLSQINEPSVNWLKLFKKSDFTETPIPTRILFSPRLSPLKFETVVYSPNTAVYILNNILCTEMLENAKTYKKKLEKKNNILDNDELIAAISWEETKNFDIYTMHKPPSHFGSNSFKTIPLFYAQNMMGQEALQRLRNILGINQNAIQDIYYIYRDPDSIDFVALLWRMKMYVHKETKSYVSVF